MNLLALSYYAPPQLTPQAIQVARLLYHLDADVTLVHGRDPHCPDGMGQYPDFFERISVLGVDDPGPRLKGVWHRAALRALPCYGACPDRLGPWRRAACGRALAQIRVQRPDVIASFGMPMSDHLLGLALKRRTGLPWLAHFSDPWADNPFHRTTALEHRLNLVLERRVIAHADQLVFTTERTLELVMGKYPSSWRQRAAVLPHAWDLGHFSTPLGAQQGSPHEHGEGDGLGYGQGDDPGQGRGRTGRHIVRHIGACYGTRSPQPLFAALARIAATRPRRLDGVAFELVGPVAPAFLRSPALRSLPPGLVTRRAHVDYRSALQLASSASALIVIEAPSRGDSVFLPSKLIDYIGARRPVWGIVPPGAAADLIGEWSGGGHTCADPDDPATVASMLESGIDALDCQPRCYGPERVALRYAPARVAHSLKQYLRHAIGRCARAALVAASLAPVERSPP